MCGFIIKEERIINGPITAAPQSLQILIDEETGVNYIVLNRYDGFSITPRFNSDGTLYITNKENLVDNTN